MAVALMPSIIQLTAEARVDECARRAAWAWARAAACEPRQFVRRWCLVNAARAHERQMDAWTASLFAEIRAAEHRYDPYEDPAA